MSVVEEVKARLDIVDVVGASVRLQKAGRIFKGLCPFHTEKTPSFTVDPQRQTWHCWGACSTGGDVISFVTRKENLDFSGALRVLAERAGVELKSDGPRREQLRGIQDANEAAALYFHSLLPNSRNASIYMESRGLDRAAYTDFQLGYAPPGWEGLRDHLVAKGFDPAVLVEAGLLIEGERGPYDRFRDRLMFPIRDDRGRVVGFGGRSLPGADANTPKYMNTPQTPIFDKGGVLYGLDRARESIRVASTAAIVEGYMDVIAAHQYGYKNVVASMGTALTDKQASLLQRFAEHVVLAMDADEAGSAANLRAIQVVAAAAEKPRSPGRSGPTTLDIRVLALPRGKDPDELIRSEPAAWEAAVRDARTVVDHLITVTSSRLDLSEPRNRSELVAEVLPVIGEITDPVLQAHYLQRLSRLARVGEETLRRGLPRRRAPGRGESASDATPLTAAAFKSRRSPGEELCLALILTRPELGALARKAVPPDLFAMSENRELFCRWRDGVDVDEADYELWEQQQTVLKIEIPYSETTQVEVAFLDCVHRLEKARMLAVKEASSLALAELEAGVRPGQVAAIAHAGFDGEAEGPAQEAAVRLREDMEAGRRLHSADSNKRATP